MGWRLTRILFLGAGALGGYFGARMTAGGADVTLLVRPGRQAQLSAGLRIESPLGDATIPVRTTTAQDGAEPYDIIVLTNKAYGLNGALESIAPFVGERTAICPLLNGIAHFDAIETQFPGATVLGGVAHIPAEMRSDGSILHRGDLQRITVGPRGGRGAEAAECLVEAAKAGGIDALYSDHIDQDLWDKWVFLASLAAGTCLMRGDVGQICRTEHGKSFMEQVLGECMAVAKAEGSAPGDKQATFYRNQLLNSEGTFKASMLTDLEAGNPTEADHILGDMILRARSHGIPTPMLAAAMTHMQVYAARRL